MEILARRVDLCFQSSQVHASQDTLNEYNEKNQAHDANASIKNISGAIEVLNKLTAISDPGQLDKIAAVQYEANSFNKFVKFSYLDFCVNSQRITEVPINDERTLFIENVVPLLKYFGNLTGLLSFRWGEKKDKEAYTVVFYANKETGDVRLADGLGSNKRGQNAFVIESSGYNQAQNIEHTLEDTVKNLAGATDCLLSIMASHSKASLTTMELVKIYSLHVILKKVSLVELGRL